MTTSNLSRTDSSDPSSNRALVIPALAASCVACRIAAGETLLAGAHLEVRGASCIARQCSDLYVDLGHAAGSIDRAIGIRAIGPAEVFLAGGPLRPLTKGANQIVVHIPAYSGLGKVYLGRMISTGPVRFEVLQP